MANIRDKKKGVMARLDAFDAMSMEERLRFVEKRDRRSIRAYKRQMSIDRFLYQNLSVIKETVGG